jgi:hypothetical protein
VNRSSLSHRPQPWMPNFIGAMKVSCGIEHSILSYLHPQQMLYHNEHCSVSAFPSCPPQPCTMVLLDNVVSSNAATTTTGTATLHCRQSCCCARATNAVLWSQFPVVLRRHVCKRLLLLGTQTHRLAFVDGTSQCACIKSGHSMPPLCSHIVAHQRAKGAVFFPSTTMGFYPAAQNMCTTQLQCGLCPEMPESIKTTLALWIGTKTAKSSSFGVQSGHILGTLCGWRSNWAWWTRTLASLRSVPFQKE